MNQSVEVPDFAERKGCYLQMIVQEQFKLSKTKKLQVVLTVSPVAHYPIFSHLLTSSSMFHNLTNDHPIPNHAFDLLRQRPLHIIIVLALPGQVDIHPRTFTRKHLGAQTFPSQIQRRAIHLIQHNRRQRAQNLHFEFRRFDDVDGGNETVDDQGHLGAVVQ